MLGNSDVLPPFTVKRSSSVGDLRQYARHGGYCCVSGHASRPRGGCFPSGGLDIFLEFGWSLVSTTILPDEQSR